jgi:hypothetical protein
VVRPNIAERISVLNVLSAVVVSSFDPAISAEEASHYLLVDRVAGVNFPNRDLRSHLEGIAPIASTPYGGCEQE